MARVIGACGAANRALENRGCMGTYFGTDGIRGVAGQLLTAEFAVQVGLAAAVVVGKQTESRPLFVIGRDTRISGPMLEAALTAGLTSGGANVELAGVIPTPGLALLTGQRGAAAGIVISASHNPFGDNGIKFFSASGIKLDDDEEAEIEQHIQHHDLRSLAGSEFGSYTALAGAVERYAEHTVRRIPVDLRGLRIAVDCANGAMSAAAPLALASSGASLTVLCAEPDGTNINAACGSTHVARLQEEVVDGSYDLGLAFDGDGDRVLAVDAQGNLVDGDFIIAILAKHLKAKSELARDTVVTTVMTNLGFHHAMGREGIEVVVTPVGDRYVVAEMLNGGFVLGGEQSGHIINTNVCSTGDGLATALLLLQALSEMQQPLAEAATVMTRLPQKLVNVRVTTAGALSEAAAVWAAVDEESRRLNGRGRVLVRPSGTEPLVRVMAEAPTDEEVEGVCDRLAEVVREQLGGAST